MRLLSIVAVLALASGVSAQEKPDAPHPKREVIEHVALTAANITFDELDAHSTREIASTIPNSYETNPLWRPFVGSDSLYAERLAVEGGLAWVGWKMHHSKRRIVRVLWWTPQAAQLAINIYSWRSNERLLSRERATVR